MTHTAGVPLVELIVWLMVMAVIVPLFYLAVAWLLTWPAEQLGAWRYNRSVKTSGSAEVVWLSAGAVAQARAAGLTDAEIARFGQIHAAA